MSPQFIDLPLKKDGSVSLLRPSLNDLTFNGKPSEVLLGKHAYRVRHISRGVTSAFAQGHRPLLVWVITWVEMAPGSTWQREAKKSRCAGAWVRSGSRSIPSLEYLFLGFYNQILCFANRYFLSFFCIWAFSSMFCLCNPWEPCNLGQKRMSDPLELELQMVMSHYLGAGNWASVLWKSTQYS